MSGYNDEYQGPDLMMHGLSDNMLIIQEADEKYEMDSMQSEQNLKNQVQRLILQKFEIRFDNTIVNNESHYKLYKNYTKSDNGSDFDSENIHSLPEIHPKLKRKMTESKQ